MPQRERMGIARAWPMFDLRLRCDDVELRIPKDDEIAELCAVARAGIHPPHEMPFAVPWTTVASPAFEHSFAQHWWRALASWKPDDWRLLLAVFVDGKLAGAQDVYALRFATFRTIVTGSWLGEQFQGRGVGTRMRACALELAFARLEARWARTEAFVDTVASKRVNEKLGYEPDGHDETAPLGVPRESVRYRIDRDRWLAHRTHDVEVIGFDADVRAMFGA